MGALPHRQAAAATCRPVEDVPRCVSVTVKLLAKMPEERYQTAAGVENDLCHCLADWKRRQCIDDCPWAKMMKESETLSKLLAAFFPKAEESTLGRILVEAVILLSMRTEADSARLLRDAAQAYKVDTDVKYSSIFRLHHLWTRCHG
jgi:hypothetical protein